MQNMSCGLSPAVLPAPTVTHSMPDMNTLVVNCKAFRTFEQKNETVNILSYITFYSTRYENVYRFGFGAHADATDCTNKLRRPFMTHSYQPSKNTASIQNSTCEINYQNISLTFVISPINELDLGHWVCSGHYMRLGDHMNETNVKTYTYDAVFYRYAYREFGLYAAQMKRPELILLRSHTKNTIRVGCMYPKFDNRLHGRIDRTNTHYRYKPYTYVHMNMALFPMRYGIEDGFNSHLLTMTTELYGRMYTNSKIKEKSSACEDDMFSELTASKCFDIHNTDGQITGCVHNFLSFVSPWKAVRSVSMIESIVPMWPQQIDFIRMEQNAYGYRLDTQRDMNSINLNALYGRKGHHFTQSRIYRLGRYMAYEMNSDRVPCITLPKRKLHDMPQVLCLTQILISDLADAVRLAFMKYRLLKIIPVPHGISKIAIKCPLPGTMIVIAHRQCLPYSLKLKNRQVDCGGGFYRVYSYLDIPIITFRGGPCMAPFAYCFFGKRDPQTDTGFMFAALPMAFQFQHLVQELKNLPDNNVNNLAKCYGRNVRRNGGVAVSNTTFTSRDFTNWVQKSHIKMCSIPYDQKKYNYNCVDYTEISLPTCLCNQIPNTCVDNFFGEDERHDIVASVMINKSFISKNKYALVYCSVFGERSDYEYAKDLLVMETCTHNIYHDQLPPLHISVDKQVYDVSDLNDYPQDEANVKCLGVPQSCVDSSHADKVSTVFKNYNSMVEDITLFANSSNTTYQSVPNMSKNIEYIMCKYSTGRSATSMYLNINITSESRRLCTYSMRMSTQNNTIYCRVGLSMSHALCPLPIVTILITSSIDNSQDIHTCSYDACDVQRGYSTLTATITEEVLMIAKASCKVTSWQNGLPFAQTVYKHDVSLTNLEASCNLPDIHTTWAARATSVTSAIGDVKLTCEYPYRQVDVSGCSSVQINAMKVNMPVIRAHMIYSTPNGTQLSLLLAVGGSLDAHALFDFNVSQWTHTSAAGMFCRNMQSLHTSQNARNAIPCDTHGLPDMDIMHVYISADYIKETIVDARTKQPLTEQYTYLEVLCETTFMDKEGVRPPISINSSIVDLNMAVYALQKRHHHRRAREIPSLNLSGTNNSSRFVHHPIDIHTEINNFENEPHRHKVFTGVSVGTVILITLVMVSIALIVCIRIHMVSYTNARHVFSFNDNYMTE